MSNQTVWNFIPSLNVLRQKATMEEPMHHPADFDIETKLYQHWSMEWAEYNNHLATLREYPVSGLGWEEGKEYVEGLNFEIKKIYVEPPSDIHCNRGGDVLTAALLPEPKEVSKPVEETNHSAMKDIPPVIYLQICDDGDDFPESFNELSLQHVTWCADKINDQDIKYTLSTERTFTLSDLLTAYDAGCGDVDGRDKAEWFYKQLKVKI